jgi:hypothetical protein
LDKTFTISGALEYGLYILSDDYNASREWEEAFMQVAHLIEESKFDSYFKTKRFNQ